MPLIGICLRWIRWIAISCIFCIVLAYFELSFRPFWVHFVTGAALWFFIETSYNLLSIRILCTNEHSIFPDFKENQEGAVYPADRKFIRTRESLENQGFYKLCALKTEILEDYQLKPLLTKVMIVAREFKFILSQLHDQA